MADQEDPPVTPDKDKTQTNSGPDPKPLSDFSDPGFSLKDIIPQDLNPDQVGRLETLLGQVQSYCERAQSARLQTSISQGETPSLARLYSLQEAGFARFFFEYGLLNPSPVQINTLGMIMDKLVVIDFDKVKCDIDAYRLAKKLEADALVRAERDKKMAAVSREIEKLEQRRDLLIAQERDCPISVLRQRINKYEGDIKESLMADLVSFEANRWCRSVQDVVANSPKGEPICSFLSMQTISRFLTGCFGDKDIGGIVVSDTVQYPKQFVDLLTLLPTPSTSLLQESCAQIRSAFQKAMDYLIGQRRPDDRSKVSPDQYDAALRVAASSSFLKSFEFFSASQLAYFDLIISANDYSHSNDDPAVLNKLSSQIESSLGVPIADLKNKSTVREIVDYVTGLQPSRARPLREGDFVFSEEYGFGTVGDRRACNDSPMFTVEFVFGPSGEKLPGKIKQVIYSSEMIYLADSFESLEKEANARDNLSWAPRYRLLRRRGLVECLDGILMSQGLQPIVPNSWDRKKILLDSIEARHPNLRQEQAFFQRFYSALGQHYKAFFAGPSFKSIAPE